MQKWERRWGGRITHRWAQENRWVRWWQIGGRGSMGQAVRGKPTGRDRIGGAVGGQMSGRERISGAVGGRIGTGGRRRIAERLARCGSAVVGGREGARGEI